MKFNREEIEAESGYGPQRTYFCSFCGGGHTTSRSEKSGISKTQHIVKQYTKNKKRTIEAKAKNEKLIKIINNYLYRRTKKLDLSQKSIFFSENIKILNAEITNIEDSSSVEEYENKRRSRLILSVMLSLENELKVS